MIKNRHKFWQVKKQNITPCHQTSIKLVARPIGAILLSTHALLIPWGFFLQFHIGNICLWNLCGCINLSILCKCDCMAYLFISKHKCRYAIYGNAQYLSLLTGSMFFVISRSPLCPSPYGFILFIHPVHTPAGSGSGSGAIVVAGAVGIVVLVTLDAAVKHCLFYKLHWL